LYYIIIARTFPLAFWLEIVHNTRFREMGIKMVEMGE